MNTKSRHITLALMLIVASVVLANLALSRPLAVGAANAQAMQVAGGQAAGGQTAGIDLAAGRYGAAALAELTVTKVTDTDDGTCDADCSLREAIAAATAGDTIVFAGGLAGQTIPLNSQLVVSKNLTIDGSSLGAPVQISGQNAVRVFSIEASGVVTLSALHIVSGTATNDYGGGIYNEGTLTLQNSILSGNWASYDGGGIYNNNEGTLTIQNSTLSGNTAADHYGGGIYSRGMLTLQNSTLSSNSASWAGGGIYNSGWLTVTKNVLSGNSTFDQGGGIYNSGTLMVQDSILSGNSADYGGGIYSYGQLTVQNSTFSGNTATNHYGGGIDNHGTLMVTNSTLSSNSAGMGGGGISNGGTLTVTNSTLSGNTATNYYGGGVYSSGMLNYENTIVANSASGGDCYNDSTWGGTIGTNAYNLVEDNTCSPALFGDPMLAPLADNGGPLAGLGPATHALLPGSPAIDAVPLTSCTISTDQRGFPRPYPAGGACDIGAYEAGPLYLAKTATPATNAPYHGLVTYTLILSNTGGANDSNVWLTDTLPAETTFDSWVIQPANTTLVGGEIRWQGDLAAGQAVNLSFQVRHIGDYGNHVINVARFSSTLDFGSGQARFDVECTPTYTVQNANDTGPGSLRQAIASVCPGGHILFDNDLSITLGSELAIAKQVTIDGENHAITVSGNNTVRAFNIAPSGIVTLSHLNIVSGTVTGHNGGGVYNEGQLTVQYSTLSSHQADEGGGIVNYGTLTVTNSTLSSNEAYHGGGISNEGWLTVTDSTLSGNSVDEYHGYGGGIYNSGTLAVQNSTLSGNSADGGGGIYSEGEVVLTLQNSTFSGNSARIGGGICSLSTLTVQNSTLSSNSANGGGGIYNAGRLTVVNSILSGNLAAYGGGIYNYGDIGHFTSTVQNSTFSANSATDGGGIYNYGLLTVQNSTLSANSATNGGGIYNTYGTLTVQNSTLSANSAIEEGGNIHNYDGNLNYENTIVANNSSGGDCYNDSEYGTIGVNAHNLVEDGSCSNSAIEFLIGDPTLAPLADNGGNTWTHALLPNSPAIDAVPLVSCTLPIDQRSFPRPYPAGGACDIGAYEAGPLRLAKIATPATSAPYHGLVTYTLVLSNTGGTDDPSVWLTDTLPAKMDFDSWVIQPANATLAGDEVRWQGSLAAGQAVSLSFQVRHTGEYNDHVVNLAQFSGASDRGWGQGSFDVECTPTYIVQNANDIGPDSLRQAIASVCPGGHILFDNDLSITLGSELAIARQVTIDGEDYAITVSGNNAVRAFAIAPSGVVTLSALNIVSGTVTGDNGGGVTNKGQLTVQYSTLSSNQADEGGGIANYGTLTVTNSTLSSNRATDFYPVGNGGGIYNEGQLTVQNSTFSDNLAYSHGGGILNRGTLRIQNSSFSSNSANFTGGGIYNEGQLTVQNNTLSGNSAIGTGGGIHNYDGELNYENTIIANSTSGGDCNNAGTIGTNAYNLVEDGSCSDGAVGFLTGDPQLGPLANNGPSAGSGQAPGTLTHALLPNSPAIDAGGAACPSTDQRGEPRDDLRCDIGAFELRFSDSDTIIKSGFAGGTPYSFGPTWISLILSAADSGLVTVTKHLAYPGGIEDDGEVPATWRITSTLATGLPLTLSLCYTDAEIAGLNEASLRAFRWDGLQWTVPVSIGLTVDEAANCVTLRGIEQLSAWTLMDVSLGSGSPTAVTLRKFGTGTTYALPLLGALVLLGALALVRRRK